MCRTKYAGFGPTLAAEKLQEDEKLSVSVEALRSWMLCEGLWQRNHLGGETAAILASFTSACRRHHLDPQHYLTQLLTNLPDPPLSRLQAWLPDQWKKNQPASPAVWFA